MTAGIMLVLMSLASSQIISDNVVGSIEVTPRIEIVEIPSEFSAFRQVGCDKYVNMFGIHIFASLTTSEDKLSEEILHPITHYGYANAYPEVFGTRPGSILAKCMDAARGEYFEQVPQGGPKSGYPAEAWYHYTDETCDYGCMVTEYIYWALTSILGTQDFPGRHEVLEVEWELNTRE